MLRSLLLVIAYVLAVDIIGLVQKMVGGIQKMLFLTNEPAKKTEINILTARDTTGPGY